jgi:DNA-binding transcriptional regulator YiaG
LSNIAAALRAEIIRLARKELRAATAKLRKASAQYRSDIAALKRRIAGLEKQVSPSPAKTDAAAAGTGAGARIRYSAKGLRAQRQRLGLSAADMGVVLGVSAHTVYHWESGKSRPRPQQMAAIGGVRNMGKREAAAVLSRRTNS